MDQRRGASKTGGADDNRVSVRRRIVAIVWTGI